MRSVFEDENSGWTGLQLGGAGGCGGETWAGPRCFLLEWLSLFPSSPAVLGKSLGVPLLDEAFPPTPSMEALPWFLLLSIH